MGGGDGGDGGAGGLVFRDAAAAELQVVGNTGDFVEGVPDLAGVDERAVIGQRVAFQIDHVAFFEAGDGEGDAGAISGRGRAANA